MKECPQCQKPFEPRRADQVFCKSACRMAHYLATAGDGGLRAPIRAVRRLGNGGVSLTIHLDPKDASNAFSLVPGAIVEVVQR